MPAPPDQHQPGAISPTVPLAQVRGHRRVGPDRTRWVMWAAVTGAVVMTLAAVVTVTRAGGDSMPQGSAPAVFAATDTPASQVPGPATAAATPSSPSPSASASASASPAVSPTPSLESSPPPGPRPDRLIARLRTTVLGLVRDGHLSSEAGAELTKRLQEADERLAEQRIDQTREKLREFAEKLVNLRDENKITSTGYQTLAAALTQLAQRLPPR